MDSNDAGPSTRSRSVALLMNEQTQQQHQQDNSDQQHGDRPLNVTDALKYLDDVKVQFADQPDVYNRFLDIMKEFKSEEIDTPGVIKRVSHLFNGHPVLIQGFNTFLPTGYRIECTTDADDFNFITVTTPTGTTMQTTNDGLQKGPILWRTTSDPEKEQIFGVDGQAMGPAVQYLQKIRNRCDPETYRQFLDILSRFHHETNPSDQAEVSKQIAMLFKDAPELRQDFRLFLPDKSQLLDDAANAASGSRLRSGTPLGDTGSLKRKRKATERVPLTKSSSSSSIVTGAGGANKRLKHANSQQDLTPSSYARPPSPQPRRTQVQTNQTAGPSSGRHQHRHHQQHHAAPSGPSNAVGDAQMHYFDRVRRALDNRETYNEFLKLVNLFTQDYIDRARFVKEARSFLGDGELWRSLKEIVGLDPVEGDVLPGSRDEGWVRKIVGGEDAALATESQFLDPHRPGKKDLGILYGSYRRISAADASVPCSGRDDMCRSVLNDEWVSHPTWSSEDFPFIAHKKNPYEEALHRTEEERHEYDFHLEALTRTTAILEPIAQKIASLPLEERTTFKLKANLGGSGKSVHARVIRKIWGRQAGGEVLQALQDTPVLAVPVVLNRLKQKDQEWKRAQKEWNRIWREVDLRSWGRSLDVKGVAWRAEERRALGSKILVGQIEAAREEGRIWRAGLVDRLWVRTRPRWQMEFEIGQAEVVKDAVKMVLAFLERVPSLQEGGGSSRGAQGGEKGAAVHEREKRRVEGFLKTFVPLFFGMDKAEFDKAFVVAFGPATGAAYLDNEGSVVDDVGDEFEAGSNNSRRGGRSGRPSNIPIIGPGIIPPSSGSSTPVVGLSGGDLRKNILKSEQAKSTSRKTRAAVAAANAAVSRAGTPSASGSRVGSPEEAATPPVVTPNGRSTGGFGRKTSAQSKRKYIFFTNTAFYVLLRLLEILYSRLHLFKSIAERLVRENLLPTANGRRTQTGRTVDTYPLPTAGVPENLKRPAEKTENAEHYYDLMLEACERLFEGEIDMNSFEDMMRYMFGVKEAYRLFTIDKLCGAIVKQVQIILGDAKSQELYEILKRERALAMPTVQDQSNSRRSAEKIIGPDENLFRIDWLPDPKSMTMQLIGKDDANFDDSEVLTGRWQEYIDSYVKTETTIGVTPERVPMPFLRRNLRVNLANTPPPLIADGSLEIKVCVRTYRLFYVPKTEDFMFRLGRRRPSSGWEFRKVLQENSRRQFTKEKIEEGENWVEELRKRHKGRTSQGPKKEGKGKEREVEKVVVVVEEKKEEEKQPDDAVQAATVEVGGLPEKVEAAAEVEKAKEIETEEQVKDVEMVAVVEEVTEVPQPAEEPPLAQEAEAPKLAEAPPEPKDEPPVQPEQVVAVKVVEPIPPADKPLPPRIPTPKPEEPKFVEEAEEGEIEE